MLFLNRTLTEMINPTAYIQKLIRQNAVQPDTFKPNTHKQT